MAQRRDRRHQRILDALDGLLQRAGLRRKGVQPRRQQVRQRQRQHHRGTLRWLQPDRVFLQVQLQIHA
ncbi:hypothetical protein B1L07_01845 [Stenotrophomonas acidaminiphila]|nr:hypothetical protein B1L07_01845 [Stenotrophomonas acidaminiphila]